MNTALKHWKEAATVILAAGRHKPTADVLKRGVDKVTHSLPTESIQFNVPHKSAFDYDVLLLKRSSKSGFMPNAYVFPGGLVESSDFSSEWLDIFKSFTKLPNFGVGIVKQPPETRPPMFSTNRLELGSPIPGDVAFRICAVRETFEESGVLLVVPKKEENSIVLDSSNVDSSDCSHVQSPPTTLSAQWDTTDLAKWRSLVIENPSNFIRMCRELECLPNIWALYEWGNWLTPIDAFEKKRRYDTAFYICCLEETPHAVQDEKEIVHLKWSTPLEVLQGYQARELWIAPPQFYDLARMCRLPELRQLHSFAQRRGLEGCEQWFPILLVTPDCRISLLPGDSLYPDKVDQSGQTSVHLTTEKSLADLQHESSNLHRLVTLDQSFFYTITVHINIKPKYKHLPPFSRL